MNDEFDFDTSADYEAEMRRDTPDMTEGEYEEFLLEQEAAAAVSAERWAERALCADYAA